MGQKQARPIFETIFAFPPNRLTLGGTAYLITDYDQHQRPTNILIDCPAWTPETISFLTDKGGVQWLVITHRGASGEADNFQRNFNCSILVQEQEMYLLSGCDVQSFHEMFELTPTSHVRWTPGYSPGTSCVYHSCYGGILFSGRHLLPTNRQKLTPLKFSKTFHWPRQLRHVERLRTDLPTLSYVCPGANVGFLRGSYIVPNAYQHLQALDLEALRQQCHSPI